jgi:hypothetical protein
MERDHLNRLTHGCDLFTHTATENAGRFQGLQPIDIPRIPNASATTREFLTALPEYASLENNVTAQITNQLDARLPLLEDQPEIAKTSVIIDLLEGNLTNDTDKKVTITGLPFDTKDQLVDKLKTYRYELLNRHINGLLTKTSSIILTKDEADFMAKQIPSINLLITNYYIANGMTGVHGLEERTPSIEFFRKEDGTVGAKAWDETAVHIMDAIHKVRGDELRSYVTYAAVALEHLDRLIRESNARLSGLAGKETGIWLSTVTDHPAYTIIKDHVNAILAQTPTEYIDEAARNLSFGIITDYLLKEQEDSNLKFLLANKINQLDPTLPVYNPDIGDALPILTAIQAQTTQPQIHAFMAVPPAKVRKEKPVPLPPVDNPLLRTGWVRNRFAEARADRRSQGGSADDITLDAAVRFRRPAPTP